MYEHILIPTDGSDTTEHAVDEALEVADRFDATVSTLYVVDTDAIGIGLGAEQVDRIRQGRFGEMDDLEARVDDADRKSTRLNSSHSSPSRMPSSA